MAQQGGRIYRIGFLGVRSRSTPSNPDTYYDAFLQGMRDLGYVEGKNLVIEWRFADGKTERLPGLAAELVKSNSEVLVTHSTPGAQVLHRATRTIPIVFMAVGNPIEIGLAKSLSRPGGNVTGQANMTNDVSSKQIQLLKELNPALSRVAVLINPENATNSVILENVQTAGQQLGIRIQPLRIRVPEEIAQAFDQATRERAEAIIVAADTLFIRQKKEIVQWAAKNRLASIFPFSEDTDAGGLMSFGPIQSDVYRRGALFVDKILKGAKPSELPIEQPTLFELVINVKTANALRIKIPPNLLVRADRLIK